MEVIVSTLGTALSIGEVDPEETGSLTERMNSDPLWNPIVAFSLIVFSIFYAPCFVTVVCIIRETGSWKWGLFFHRVQHDLFLCPEHVRLPGRTTAHNRPLICRNTLTQNGWLTRYEHRPVQD